MTDSAHENYLKCVADVLKQTGHPRRAEVLDDLRDHLAELATLPDGPADMATLIDQLGSPEEYAENLAPATGYRVVPWHKRPRMRVALMLTLACAMIAGLYASYDWLAAGTRMALGKNFTANPFFDLSRAKAIAEGATPDDIRNAIGYPLRRYQGWDQVDVIPGDMPFVGHGSSDEVIWEYTMLADPNAPFYTVCLIITGAEDAALHRVECFTRFVPEDRRWDNFRTPRRHYTGTVDLIRNGQPARILAPDDDKVYVLLTTIVEDDVLTECEAAEARLRTMWTDVNPEQVQVLHTPLVLNDHVSLDERIRAIAGDPPIYSNVQLSMGPITQGKGVSHSFGHAYVYYQGYIYHYPPEQTGDDASLIQAWYDDQSWLLTHLTQANAEQSTR